MNIKNTKVGTQLKVGFAIILLFVLIMGVVAYIQTGYLHQQTDTMYQHPLIVRRALSILESDVLKINIDIRDLLVVESENEQHKYILDLALLQSDIKSQFTILNDRYLGPKADIDAAYEAYISWELTIEENIGLIRFGNIETARQNIYTGSQFSQHSADLDENIRRIDAFSFQKGETLYAASVQYSTTLKTQLFSIMAVIIVLVTLIVYILLRNTHRPLNQINDAVQRFRHGDMQARSNYTLKNEFGILSSSINELADMVQSNIQLNSNLTYITNSMLSTDNDVKFFRNTLEMLSTYTESQMAALYLLSDDEKAFYHFDSIGLGSDAKKVFFADVLEGEFGAALLSHKIQYIKDIPSDSQFIFETVSGKFIPREIITIPILSGNRVTAIISLASITQFNSQSLELLNRLLDTLHARVEGVLAYKSIREYRNLLEKQNVELNAQKNELALQSTELIQQNEELKMQKNQVDEASRLKTNFLSNMSHELRTPLNSVIALSGVLNRRLTNKITEEESGFLEIIERNGKNLLLLINDILDISRIEAGYEVIELSTFNVQNVIADIVTTIKPQANQKGIALYVKNADAEIKICSDEKKIYHILQNIIANAVKFTEEGNVTISSEKSVEQVIVKIVDTGIGISDESLPHIFEEFRQADSSTSRRFGGTGLGLAIAQKYATMLGGTISVTSIVDKGSEFSLSIPLQYEEGAAVENEIMYAENKLEPLTVLLTKEDASEKTILLVDDNESALIQISDLLVEMGYHVLTARGGAEALAHIESCIPDAMILDLMMPGIDGFYVLEILRNAERTAHVPVLILTAKHITKEELKFLRKNHIHELIQKGDIERNKFKHAIANLLLPSKVKESGRVNKSQLLREKPVVLVVEDNPDNMTTVRALLSDQYTVLEATDASQGIKMALEHIPDLILMDIALTGMDGIEAFHYIRGRSKSQNIPIIALTASAMEHERETILAHGFDSFIAKPIIANQFFEVINEVLYGK